MPMRHFLLLQQPDAPPRVAGPHWFLLVVLAALLPTSVGAASLRVPDEYSTIGEAVAVAEWFDTIDLAPGTYAGPGNRGEQDY